MNSKLLDPNPNFFSTNSELLSNCIYLTSSEFNKIPFPPDAFSAFHINIRSLPKHFDDLSEYLLSLNMLFSVVAVSETWLHKSNPDLFNIPGYHFISNSKIKILPIFKCDNSSLFSNYWPISILPCAFQGLRKTLLLQIVWIS